MSRNRAYPPPVPSKDAYYRSSSSASPTLAHADAYADANSDDDLASAVRDVVHISKKPVASGIQPPIAGIINRPHSRTPPPFTPGQPSLPSANMTAATAAAFQPSHGYSLSSPDMSSVMHARAVNPFEQDEIEPPEGQIAQPYAPKKGGAEAAGMVSASRAKFSRALTNNASISSAASLLPPSPGKGRIRRSVSNDSYGLHADRNGEVAEDKRPGRHGDVIDTWDPTGLGSAMWHHAGPYDAAAPSRNVNLPSAKAPMQAFNGAPVTSPPRTGPSTISLSSPPTVPPKPRDADRERRPPPPKPGASRRTSGGLSAQYSTSVPTSGGYFPDQNAPKDEAELARLDRQRQREDKRRALKAAWGIDTPEPFEDFGASPSEENIDLEDDLVNDLYAKPSRSPGLRLGLGPRTPPVPEEGVGSPGSEDGPRGAPSAFARPGGVKRTKSLMQKIKSMRCGTRRHPRDGSGQRSSSPAKYSPTTETRPPLPMASPLESPTNMTAPLPPSSRRINTSDLPRPPQRASPAKHRQEYFEEEDLAANSTEPNGFVLVESPSSKARALKALKREQREREGSSSRELSSPSGETSPTAGTQAGNTHSTKLRTLPKTLPQPPVAPVMPDFNDLVAGRSNWALAVPEHESTIRRKPSLVKKLKERINK
ncbi:hypothetical protein Q5752_001581 [Cryptotrichosporon argae]